MAFYRLFQPKSLEKKPWLIFVLSFSVVSIAVLLAYRIFPESSSVLIVTFTIIPLIPIITKMIEESASLIQRSAKSKWNSFFKRHKIIKVYLLLFFFLSLSFSLWYAFLPQEKANQLFLGQINVLNGISQGFSFTRLPHHEGVCDYGFFAKRLPPEKIASCQLVDYDHDFIEEYLITLKGDHGPTLLFSIKDNKLYNYSQWMYFHIVTNNLLLLFFIFLTSFIFGAGAIFTIAWNASLLGVFLGDAVHRTVNFFSKIPKYFTALSSSLVSIAFHGIIELTGFTLAALAGGILSVAFVRFLTEKEYSFEHVHVIMTDALWLMLGALLCIVASAFIEIF